MVRGDFEEETDEEEDDYRAGIVVRLAFEMDDWI